MDLGNFTNPLEAVQLISIFSYLNTLNDILYVDNYLNKTDQHKRIPIVNALYHYLLDENKGDQEKLNERKIRLVRRLINGTDLYGGKENEIPALQFVNNFLNHLVKSLIFEKYGNILGFIAQNVRSSTNESLTALMNRLEQSLRTLSFENEFGENSALDPLVAETVFDDFVKPLFPTGNESIISIDFIYGQAGLFLGSQEIGMNRSGILENQENIKLAHAVEQLVAAGQLKNTALKIFALPALIYYVYTQKDLVGDIRDIVNEPEHWAKAYETLFAYLNQTYQATSALENDKAFQFYLALSTFRNRTTLAREIIENNCPVQDIEHEVTRYKNNPSSYKCGGSLIDLNHQFRELNHNISVKYRDYEIEACRQAFGEDLINSVNGHNVTISRALFNRYFYITIGFDSNVALIKSKDDLFEFSYDNGTYLYYALIRTGYHVKIIKVIERPELLRRKILGKMGRLRNNLFSSLVKRREEDFDCFLSKIAEERSQDLNTTLNLSGYDRTRKEWWKELGLSLIPFYTCVNSIKDGKKMSASISCSIDVVLLVPVIGAATNVAGKMVSSTSKSLITLSHTTFSTLALRTSMRSTLKVTGSLLTKEVAEFITIFELKTFQKLGISVARLMDPGFEFFLTVGKGGYRSIENFVNLMEKKSLVSFETLKRMIKTSESAVTYVPKQVGTFKGMDVFINSLNGIDGFGYKYIRIASGQIVEMRTIPALNQELPVILKRIDENRIYQRIDVESGEIFGDEILIEATKENFGLDVVDGNSIGKSVKNVRKMNLIEMAIEQAVKKNKFTATEIRKELRKYDFPDTAGRREINFVEEWTNELKIPSWAGKYKIAEPDLFFQLKYKDMMDLDMKFDTAARRIESLYPVKNYRKLLHELPVDKVFTDFSKRRAFIQMKFEDYYALRNYGAFGYKKMATNCDEARRMKNSIYRLAIRQSEDPNEIFVESLFRGESRIPEAIEKELSSNEIQLTRFTSTSTDSSIAMKYSQMGSSANTQVFYEMKFEEPILRARVEDFMILNEKETILLPGTKFRVDNVKRWSETSQLGVKENFIKVEMTCVDQLVPKVERQQGLMKEIGKLVESDTIFYADDVSKIGGKLN